MNSDEKDYEPFTYLRNFILFVIAVAVWCFGIPALLTSHLRDGVNYGDMAFGTYIQWWIIGFLIFTALVFRSAYKSLKVKNRSEEKK